MDEDEQEDLLVNVSDSDDSPEENDAYLDLSRKVNHDPPFRHGLGGRCCFKKRVEFLSTGILCLFSASALLITLPLYLETSSQVADIYPSILFLCATSSVLTFSCICLCAKFQIFSFSNFKKNVIPPIPLWKLVQIGLFHSLGGLCVSYSLDRQRVLCHLQDPLKGIILVFSMVYYFCFSRKIMGLQKVFCTTTIIIGLFVSVDYALCDEFHCRGYEREKVEDDSGQWNHATHFLWSLIYLLGLALWCFHFSFLERQIVTLSLEYQLACRSPTSLLETISCMVSSQNESTQQEVEWGASGPTPSADEHSSRVISTTNYQSTGGEDQQTALGCGDRLILGRENVAPKDNYPSAFSLAFWVYAVSFFTTLLLFWTSLIPSVGKISTWHELLNTTHLGLLCHFQTSSGLNHSSSVATIASHQISCGLLAQYGWLFAICLLLFSVSAYHFLMLCQSSVFTVAVITSALPVANVFWSLFRLSPVNGGFIEWWPNFTPELVCTFLGIPIIGTGLVLLCKAHWTNTTQKELCCTLRYHPRPPLT
ncbi:ABC transporter L-arabinose-binding periplasmic protein [Frankliniella fusca]|uniref:ABC transporter L-arabinose-binding periplasmic protein n=1 Tax=Frankliniella fusca TaxID=407009 RepID=A0AAE1LCB7_9NEOP|nr:ABC transporter L-arabinose-binding periplasmic protein [Frankliniella fusca]